MLVNLAPRSHVLYTPTQARPEWNGQKQRCASLAVGMLLGCELFVPSRLAAQTVEANNGTIRVVSTPTPATDVNVGTVGNGTLNVIDGGSLTGGPFAGDVQPIQIGTGGTGLMSVTGTGSVEGFGLNLGASGTFDLSSLSAINPSLGAPGVVLENLTGSGAIKAGTSVLLVGVDGTSGVFSGSVSLAGSSAAALHGQFIKTGTGTLTIDGANIGRVTPSADEGETVVGQGALAQTSGNTRLTSLVLGLTTSDGLNNGTLEVSGGTLTLDTGLTVGSFGGTGSVNQTGGTVLVQPGCGDPARCAALNIGNQGGSGSYSISNGLLQFDGPGFLVLGRNQSSATASSGTMNITGGQVLVNAGGSVIIGNNINTASFVGSGTIDQSGGTLTIANGATLNLSGSGNGIYNLGIGATLEIGGASLQPKYLNATNPSTYAFNLGGTVRVLGTPLDTAANATLTGNAATVDTAGLGATWNGVLSGAGALTKAGAGTLTLTAANTYAGPTTITGGTLALTGSGGLNPLGALTVGSAGAFDFSAVTTQVPGLATGVTGVVLGSLSGSGAVSAGAQTLVVGTDNTSQAFSGRMSFTGDAWDAAHGVFIKAGTGILTIDNATIGRAAGGGGGEVFVGGGALAQTSGATTLSTLVLGVGADPATNAGLMNVSGGGLAIDTSLVLGSFGGIGTVNQSGGSVAVNFCGDVTHCSALSIGNQGGTGTYNISGGTLAFNGPGKMVLGRNESASVITPSTGTLAISGSGQVNVNSGDLVIGNWLSGAGAQGTGVINQTGGVLTIASDANLYVGGFGAGTYNLNAGTLQVGGSSLQHNYGSGAGASVFNLGGGTVQVLGAPLVTDIAANLVNGTTSSIDTNGIGATWTGLLSGDGTLGKTGAGTLTLPNANSYTGGTTLKAGRIDIGNAGAIGSGPLRMDDGTTLGFTADGLSLVNAIELTGRNDPVIDTGSFSETVSGAISGTGQLTKDGTGTLTLTAPNTYSGGTTVAAGTLRAGAANTFSSASNHSVSASATLDLANLPQRVAGLNNAGTVLVGTGTGNALTVTGPVVGNGGVVSVGVGASGAADRLVLDGASAVASGVTNIVINNDAGLGAPTSGNGIELVTGLNGANTTAQTTKNAFAVAGGHVDVGAYEYKLVPADASGGGQNWYLRTGTVDPLPPVPPVPPDPNVLPPTPPVVVPTYRVEVPLLAALPSQMRQAGVAMLSNLNQRIGDDDVSGSGAYMATGPNRRAWARVISTDMEIQQGGTVSPKSEGRLFGLQAGTDLWAMQNWRAGLYYGQLDGDIDVSGFARGVRNLSVGDNDLRSQFLGVYGTYSEPSGWYVDTVLQGGRHRYQTEPANGIRVSERADSWIASVEAGKSFPLAANWSIEPQAQLAYQRLTIDDFRVVSTTVRNDAESDWLARVGVRVKGQFATQAGVVQPYGRLNVYWASSGTDVLRFTSPAAVTDITSPTGHTSTELAAGATLTMNGGVSFYGEVGQLWASGGDARVKSSLLGSLGLRVRW